jgi:DNA replication ATP-dependent helicase Dna2
MPGTGKTTSIAHIISLLVARGKTILLTSYTHTAVDNLLLKLITEEIPFIRLGKTTNIHPALKKFTIDAYNLTTTDSITGNNLLRFVSYK